jgi:hypothetical protein
LALGNNKGWTQSQEGELLRQEIKELKTRLQGLEERLARQETAKPGLLVLEGINISGNLSASVNYNFNEPDDRTNGLRIFDSEANTFQLDLFELVLEKEAPSEGGVGFRVDLDYGDVAESTGSSGLGSTSDEFDLQQAYINLNLPWGNFSIGKFVTLLGYEVIESWDNLNTSRSYLFGYAIPFTHTGILGNWKLSGALDLSLGLVNGWDNFDDNNDAKTVLGRIGINPTDRLSIGVTGIYGAEQASDNGSQRGVVDLVATLQAMDRLTLGLNYDYGTEEFALAKDVYWSGLAGYLHYQINDFWGIALRAEFFEDKGGSRTGTAQELWEATLTSDFKLFDNCLLRLEYRHDDSDKNSFNDRATAVDTQDTLSAELIYSF